MIRAIPVIGAACCLLLSIPAAAQQPPDPSAAATVHVGPLALRPTIAISNAGIDTNVFNEVEDRDPKSDWTFTVGPQSDVWLRLGRARLSGRAAVTYDWFATYRTQRSIGTTNRVRLELPLARIRPYVGGSYLSMRDRPGYEIDIRVRHREGGLNGGIEFPISKRSTFAVGWEQVVTRFDADARFDGTWLRDVLNRRNTVAKASARYAVTPLTTMTLEGEVGRERFPRSPERDANSFRIVPGVQFDTFALIDGSAKVGYRRLKMLTAGMPDFQGVVASVNLGYTLMGVTRFGVVARRDIEYSYWPEEPYYVLTGTTVTLTQAVGGPWALTARAGLQHLAYRQWVRGEEWARASAPATSGGRVDSVRLYGGGLSYKLGPDTRLGFNADYYTRRSDYDYRDYRGLRAGTSVTYGF